MKKNILLYVFLALVFVAFLFYLTLKGQGVRVEVCLTFEGTHACRTARGPNEQAAKRTAQENACALITSGMTSSIACQNAPPDSVRLLN